MNVSRQIATIVQNADNLNHILILARSVDHEVSGIAHDPKPGLGALTAEPYVISENVFTEFRPPLRARPLRILRNVDKRLLKENPIPLRRSQSKFLQAPIQNVLHICLCGRAENCLPLPARLSHDGSLF
mgnify:CR=1 FL=1